MRLFLPGKFLGKQANRLMFLLMTLISVPYYGYSGVRGKSSDEVKHYRGGGLTP